MASGMTSGAKPYISCSSSYLDRQQNWLNFWGKEKCHFGDLPSRKIQKMMRYLLYLVLKGFLCLYQNLTQTPRVPGHDKDIEKIMLPMLLGLKLSGLATATFTILKIFVLQALMASKVALLGAVVLVLKALYVYLRDKVGHVI